MENYGGFCVECLHRYVGQTVTIFTTSGGLSGSGFTGVLLSVNETCVKLLVRIGQPPRCPIGSACTNWYSGMGNYEVEGNEFYGNPMGALCVIPCHAIACFTHNAIA